MGPGEVCISLQPFPTAAAETERCPKCRTLLCGGILCGGTHGVVMTGQPYPDSASLRDPWRKRLTAYRHQNVVVLACVCDPSDLTPEPEPERDMTPDIVQEDLSKQPPEPVQMDADHGGASAEATPVSARPKYNSPEARNARKKKAEARQKERRRTEATRRKERRRTEATLDPRPERPEVVFVDLSMLRPRAQALAQHEVLSAAAPVTDAPAEHVEEETQLSRPWHRRMHKPGGARWTPGGGRWWHSAQGWTPGGGRWWTPGGGRWWHSAQGWTHARTA